MISLLSFFSSFFIDMSKTTTPGQLALAHALHNSKTQDEAESYLLAVQGMNLNFDVKISETHYSLISMCGLLQGTHALKALMNQPGLEINRATVDAQHVLYSALIFEREDFVRQLLTCPDLRLGKIDIGNIYSPVEKATIIYHSCPILLHLLIADGRSLWPIDVSYLHQSQTIVTSTWWSSLEEAIQMLVEFKKSPWRVRNLCREETGWKGCPIHNTAAAANIYALIVFKCDGLLELPPAVQSHASRFFSIAQRLPMELQQLLCLRVRDSSRDIIAEEHSEKSFKELAGALIESRVFAPE